ncbi:hypothetical protein [Pedobacter aquatilis]|uniref:hypothetical protein n=1 Tax=Pedobacter aquatilis TaxID=351343 RepID=UPI00292E27D2|nr:hypothetical protein [Pedobacter aquatilis]
MKRMLVPLEEFRCDTCGDIIESPKTAYLEWNSVKDENGKLRATNFKIVHHDPANNVVCSENGTSTTSLEKYVGSEGSGNLWSFIDEGEIVAPNYTGPRALNLREFTEVARRLSMPHYEEARDFLHMAESDGYISSNQYGIYSVDKLQFIIEKYGADFED